MKYVFLAVFIISTVIHLYASLKQNKKLRNLSKPWILLALLGFYLFSVEEASVFVILALIFSWLGDVFLIGKGNKYFAIGGIAFMISHIFFILAYINDIDFSVVPIWPYFVFGTIYAITVTILFINLKKHLPKPLFYPMYLYLLINGTMNCFAIFRLFSGVCPGSILTVIGACLFFISDSSLFFVRFNKNSILKTHFLVMLTYSIGELLIVLGLILL